MRTVAASSVPRGGKIRLGPNRERDEAAALRVGKRGFKLHRLSAHDATEVWAKRAWSYMPRSTNPDFPNHFKTFSGPTLLQIAMPMGGIGSGCVCLAGHGGLVDWSLKHRPATSALPDGFEVRRPGAFALLHIKGEKPITRLVEGPISAERIYDQGLQSQGYRHVGFEGLPRFAEATFRAAYPFGGIGFRHPQVPLEISLTAFSPFIPLDDRNSSLPCAVMEYHLHNPTASPIEFDFSYHVLHLAVGRDGNKSTRNEPIGGFGVQFSNTDPPMCDRFGTGAFGVVGHEPKIKAMWFRGRWFDWISALWREVSTGTFKENDGKSRPGMDGLNGGSILMSHRLGAGESVTFPIVIAWHFPNSHFRVGGIGDPPPPGEFSPPEIFDDTPPAWQPWYAGQFSDAAAVAKHVRENYASLRSRTLAFANALGSSTFPPEVIDAVSSNLAILKSPTILRQRNGNLWAWEGCFTTHGSCHGSCTHVWNYAQALPHLFPTLERGLREAEYLRSIDEAGHVQFRAALPDGPTPHDFHAAADGQLGGILKLYRDWQISGDRAWMQGLYPLAKRSLEYCVRTWDPQRRGILAEPHHNTYDIEFWGPDGMCTSVYVGALAAISLMATELGLADDARTYRELTQRAAAFMDQDLFNGEYHQQNVEWRGLRDQSFAKLISASEADHPNPEMLRLLKAEGPKYQYGAGCISDGVIGAWMATLYGVQTPLSREKVRQTLSAIYRHNFKADLSDHLCTQRPGYATGCEPGLVLCTWPRGQKPVFPFVYSDEVWTGIEYQIASHLIMEGMVDEGLAIVRAVRSRYDGHVRNPFNEYECGSYYARALSSYALIQSLSGFRYSAATKELWLAPRLEIRPFTTFFSAANGFGTLTLNRSELIVRMVEGALSIDNLHVVDAGETVNLKCSAKALGGKELKIKLK
jgi:uncharacterized protein (DUF608 family)